MSRPRRHIEYALYKGDEFLDIGTAEQLGSKFDLSANTVKYYASNAHLERLKKKDDGIVAVRLEGDNET